MLVQDAVTEMLPMEAALVRAISRTGRPVDAIADLKRLSGGASQELWGFAAVEENPRRFVMRRARDGVEVKKETQVGLDQEGRLQIAAAEAGVPVARVACLLEPGDGLGPGFIMEHVLGETVPKRIFNGEQFAYARTVLPQQCAEALARIHRIDAVDGVTLKVSDAAGELAQYWRNYQKLEHPHPVFELAFRWLRDNAPAPLDRHVLVHGDFRMGNLMVDAEGLRAVLDWEISHLGDPMEDFGYLCVPSWRFGNLDLPAGGIATREQIYSAYAAAGGTVDLARAHYWEVLSTLKWGVIAATMAKTFADGIDASVERGTIARRASETELDLLHLLTDGL
jgi:aminoglycoside phosphotransferase (APT) family kinase protein